MSADGEHAAASENVRGNARNAPRERRCFGADITASVVAPAERAPSARRTASPSQLRDIMADLDDSSAESAEESESETGADEFASEAEDVASSAMRDSRRARRESFGFGSFGADLTRRCRLRCSPEVRSCARR